MADTADLRSEGKNSQTPSAIISRNKRLDRIAKGVCVKCGKTPVLNRVTCYECSSYQVEGTYLSGLRYYCQYSNIDPDSMLQFLNELPWQTEAVQSLKTLMSYAQKKIKNETSCLHDK